MKFLIFTLLLTSMSLSAKEDFSFLDSPKARSIGKSKKTIKGQTDFIFTDGYGREVHLRGTNTTGNTKHPELEHLPFKDVLQSEKEAEIFKTTTGGNFVRWLFNWEGPHKAVDEIDYDHLDKQIAQMRSFMKRGIFILIDFHQDLFSRHIKDGSNGAPKFIVDGMKVPQTGCGKICPTWSVNYITNKGVRQAFAKFWKNEVIQTEKGPRGVQDEFFYMLEKTFSYFKEKLTPEELSMIIGLDPMNEPTHGYYDRGERYNDWVNNKLFPFYQRARNTLDKLGFKNVFIFAEPGTFWNVKLPLLYVFVRPSGPLKLKTVPKGNWVFNAHTYDEVRESYGLFKAENGVYMKEMELVRDEARKMQAPPTITEFGAWLHAKKKWVFDPHRILKASYQGMEMSMNGKKRHRRPDYYTSILSNTFWEWKIMSVDKKLGMGGISNNPGHYHSSSNLIMERAYPRRIAGDLINFFYNDTGRDSYKDRKMDWVSLKPLDNGVEYFADNKFALISWKGKNLAAPTEVFLPRHFNLKRTVVITNDHSNAMNVPSKVKIKDDYEGGGHRLLIYDQSESSETRFAFIVELKEGEVYTESKLKWFQNKIANKLKNGKNPLYLRGKIKFDRPSYRLKK
ncbi:MAG: hypothetical protein ACO20H_06845 [Bacteriovoracaceae bacterium]